MCGVPLAIEQARAMIKQGIPVRDFVGHYKTQYQKVMAQKPARSAWDYEKNMSIASVFNMLLAKIKKDSKDDKLLSFLSCFGPRRVDVNLMGQVRKPGEGSLSTHSDWSDVQKTDEMIWLDRLWSDRLEFQVVTGQLESLCALKRIRDSEGDIISISLHDSITQWRFETLTNDVREKWILAAAYALSKCLPKDMVDPKPQIRFLPLVRHFYNIIRRYIDPQKLEAPAGEFCQQYGTLMTRFAQLYLNSGYTAEGESVFLQAISHQKFVEMSSWPKGRRSLLLLKGFAIILSKNGNMGVAAETMEALHAASMEQLGSGDEITSWAAARLPAVRETKHRNANNEQRAIVASRGGKLSSMSPEVNSLTSNKLGKLPFAASTGDIEGVREEMDPLEIFYEYKPMLSTALSLASHKGHTAVVELLLKHDVDVDIDHKDYALVEGSRQSLTAMFKLLLRNRAKVNIHHRRCGTALLEALYNGHVAVAELLVKYGADLNVCDESHQTALHQASYGGHTAVAELLLKYGADVNDCDKSQSTALHLASYGGHSSVVEMLLNHRANVDAQNRYHVTALQIAIRGGHQTLVELLLTKGADVNADYLTQGTALRLAIVDNNLSIGQLLIKNGADVNARTSRGTPLQVASFRGCTDFVDLLKAAGARDDDGGIPSSTEADNVEIIGSGELC